jgi:methionyl-tRNA formyltransferase
MKDPRIIFFGTPDFAVSILQELLNMHYNVVLAVSQPDKPVGRKHHIEPTPIHVLADANEIPVLQPVKLSDSADEVLSYRPDLIVTCAYGQFVNTKILSAPSLGCLNIHPSLLPKYRGGAPIQRTILNGDTETGVSLMEMVKGMDSGRVYAVEKTAVDPDETMSQLSERLNQIAVGMIDKYLPAYLEGKLQGVEQDSSKVVIAPNISREEEQVMFQKEDLQHVYNHIRGLLDLPVSYGMIEGKRIKFYRAGKSAEQTDREFGTVIGFDHHAMLVACTGGILEIYELQPEGKKRMDADSFRNGTGRELIGKRFD